MQARKPKSRADQSEVGEDEAGGERTSIRYRSIANELQAAIAQGRFSVGASLPTEAELCAQFRLAVTRCARRYAGSLTLASSIGAKGRARE
jgi:hypothetical protein